MNTEEEIGFKSGSQWTPQTGAWRRHGSVLLWESPEEKNPGDIFISGFWFSEPWENKYLRFKPWNLCHSVTETLEETKYIFPILLLLSFPCYNWARYLDQ